MQLDKVKDVLSRQEMVETLVEGKLQQVTITSRIRPGGQLALPGGKLRGYQPAFQLFA